MFSAGKPFMPSVKVVQREPADGSAPFSQNASCSVGGSDVSKVVKLIEARF